MTRHVVLVALAAAVLLGAGPTSAGPAAAELTLDASAVAELLRAASAEPVPLAPGVELRFEPRWRVVLAGGEIQATVGARLEPLGWSGPLELVLAPEVDRLTGVVRLVARRVAPAGATWPVEVDLASVAPAFELPRRLDWRLELPGGGATDVGCWIQGAEIAGDRLRIELGLEVPAVSSPP